MRLALITRRYPPLLGGAERALSYLAPALAEAGGGHTVRVLTEARDAAAALPALEPIPTGRGALTVQRLGTLHVRFAGTWLYMRRLSAALAEFRPDLIYVSMLKHDAFAALGVAGRLGIPVVLRPEGAGATGDVAWQAGDRFGPRIAARCRQADALVAISKPVRSELIVAGHDPDRIVELPNGVPVPAQPWQRRPDWRSAPRAVFVGRLAPEKGLDSLIAAWPAVRAEHPGATLTLLGEGPERPGLTAQVERLGLGAAVSLPGAVQEVEPHLRAADLFVLPSREEGMSIALLEAMALGVPLVASAIPGNRRLVGDFKHGRLAPPDDPAALAATVLDQWAHFDRAHHMSRAARSLVTQQYSVAAVARRHLELFERLVAARGAGSGPPPPTA